MAGPVTDEEVRVYGEARPAGRMLNFFVSLFAAVGDGKIHLLRLAVVLREYTSETYLARPPLLVQKVVVGVLAR